MVKRNTLKLGNKYRKTPAVRAYFEKHLRTTAFINDLSFATNPTWRYYNLCTEPNHTQIIYNYSKLYEWDVREIN